MGWITFSRYTSHAYKTEKFKEIKGRSFISVQKNAVWTAVKRIQHLSNIVEYSFVVRMKFCLTRFNIIQRHSTGCTCPNVFNMSNPVKLPKTFPFNGLCSGPLLTEIAIGVINLENLSPQDYIVLVELTVTFIDKAKLVFHHADWKKLFLKAKLTSTKCVTGIMSPHTEA